MEEVPVLIRTDWYNCPDCKTISPRKDMLTKRTAKLSLAGVIPSTPYLVFQASGTMVDDAQGTSTVSTGQFDTDKTRQYVVAVSAASSTGAPTSVSYDGLVTQLTLLKSAVTALGHNVSLWLYNPDPNSGDGTGGVMTAQFGVTLPTAACIACYQLVGAITSNTLDASASATGTSTSPASGAAVSTKVGQIAIGAIATNGSTAVTSAWKDGVTGILNLPTTTSAIRNTRLDVGILPLPYLGSLNASLTVTPSSPWAAVAVTLRSA